MTLSAQYDKLTPTEVRALTHLADGKSTATAAFKMRIKPETLMSHLRRVRHKVGDGSRAYVLNRCYTLRLMPLPLPEEAPVSFPPRGQAGMERGRYLPHSGGSAGRHDPGRHQSAHEKGGGRVRAAPGQAGPCVWPADRPRRPIAASFREVPRASRGRRGVHAAPGAAAEAAAPPLPGTPSQPSAARR
ncbi:helix-turn-helix transcriptional regulator [Streptomyces chrestomyceticus]|uniref:helix-turn-helix transcriptional regulator n=1 Tax=Streptomyces chrestomyceticus TaxID=68185 RepID=UPI0036D0D57B